MKIAVLGYSGSGKSTLAYKLGEQRGIEALHLDSVFWLHGWTHRSREEMRGIVGDYLDTRADWVIDGNYSKICFERRMEEADLIVLLQFSALNCLWRVWKRYQRNKGCTRPDMGEGCPEKLDGEFVRWILWKGRDQNTRNLMQSIREKYPEKVVWIRNQRQLDDYMREYGLCLK